MLVDVDERRDPISGRVDGFEQHVFSKDVHTHVLAEVHHKAENLSIEKGMKNLEDVVEGPCSSDR